MPDVSSHNISSLRHGANIDGLDFDVDYTQSAVTIMSKRNEMGCITLTCWALMAQTQQLAGFPKMRVI